MIQAHFEYILFLSQGNPPEDDQLSGRNMLVTIIQQKNFNIIEVHLFIFNIFYASN